MARSSNWNDDLIKQLVSLYNEGKYSTKQIGDILGFSKNAIVGKIHRLELNKNKPEKEILPSAPTPSKEVVESSVVSTPKVVATTSRVVAKQDKPSANKLKHYKLEEISLNMCVWPYGENEFTFCGAKIMPGKPYCQEHFEKAYLKFNKKVKKA